MEKVAVIGAGFSGLTTAIELQKCGYSVTLFEKESFPGGQCMSVPALGGTVETGCVFATSPAVEELCRSFGIKVESTYFYRQFLDGEGNKIPQLDEPSILRFKKEYDRLPGVLKNYESFRMNPGFQEIHKDLNLDFTSWCRLHDFYVLPEVYGCYFSGFGYGQLEDIPALYVLEHLDSRTLGTMVESRKVLTFPNGSGALCSAMARSLNDIRYNSNVIRIKTDRNITVVTGWGSEEFGRVVITTPLPSGVLDHPVFSEILRSYRQNHSSTFVYSLPDSGLIDSFIKENFNKEGRLRLLHVNSIKNGRSLVTAYCSGDLDEVELDLSIRETLSKMGITEAKLIISKKWRFFPHVSSENLEKGFYTTLLHNQGLDGVYLGGALSCCSSLDKIAEFSPFFVKRYF